MPATVRQPTTDDLGRAARGATARRPLPPPALGPATLAVASFASIGAALVAAALGSGAVASLMAAALAPWITAFLSLPGPRRHRRAGAVAALAGLLFGARKALACVPMPRRLRARLTTRRRRRAGVPAAGRPVGRARRATTIAGIATVVAILALTLTESVLGQALTAKRRFTLLPVGGEIDRAAAAVERPVGAETPTGSPAPAPSPGAERHDEGGRGAGSAPAAGIGDGTATAPPLPDATADTAGASGAVGRAEVPVGDDHPRAVPPADGAGPVLELPSGVEAATADPRGAVVVYRAAASDAQDRHVEVSCSPPSGSRFGIGRTVVRCAARDGDGNATSGRFAVRVRPLATVGTPDINPSASPDTHAPAEPSTPTPTPPPPTTTPTPTPATTPPPATPTPPTRTPTPTPPTTTPTPPPDRTTVVGPPCPRATTATAWC